MGAAIRRCAALGVWSLVMVVSWTPRLGGEAELGAGEAELLGERLVLLRRCLRHLSPRGSATSTASWSRISCSSRRRPSRSREGAVLLHKALEAGRLGELVGHVLVLVHVRCTVESSISAVMSRKLALACLMRSTIRSLSACFCLHVDLLLVLLALALLRGALDDVAQLVRSASICGRFPRNSCTPSSSRTLASRSLCIICYGRRRRPAAPDALRSAALLRSGCGLKSRSFASFSCRSRASRAAARRGLVQLVVSAVCRADASADCIFRFCSAVSRHRLESATASSAVSRYFSTSITSGGARSLLALAHRRAARRGG